MKVKKTIRKHCMIMIMIVNRDTIKTVRKNTCLIPNKSHTKIVNVIVKLFKIHI